MPLAWRWCRFEDLGVNGVYDMLALRAKVFILEQGPYLDPDGAELLLLHLARDLELADDARDVERAARRRLVEIERALVRALLEEPGHVEHRTVGIHEPHALARRDAGQRGL